MKLLVLVLSTMLTINAMSQAIDYNHIQQAVVSREDSMIYLTANIRLDHRIFGYEKPETTSKKLILFSVFTSDVEHNPYKCTYGAYYQTSDMRDITIKYTGSHKQFIKQLLKNNSIIATMYILKRWVQFER